MDYLSFVLCLLLAWIAIYLLLTITKKDHKSCSRRLPPGPLGVPIFGNLLSLGNQPHITLANLAKTYGPLMSLQLGRVYTVVISSPVMAKEALQKNDLSFANRHVIDAVCALDHHERSVGWLPVGPKWRNLRKVCNSQVFSTSRLDSSQTLRRDKVKDLLLYVEKSRQAGVAVDVWFAGFITSLNLLSTTFFSLDLGDPSSELALEFRTIVRTVVDELGKPNFADYFPILKKVDPQGIRRRTTVNASKFMDVFNKVIEQRLKGGRPSGSVQNNDVLDALLGIIQERTDELELADISHLLLDMFVAGTDTTATILEWTMAELLHNPEKLRKAQAELNEIIGKRNSVEESDIVRLPYLKAVVKEAFRLHPPVPLSIPRKAESDVKLFGFTVPKNAQVLVNVWAIGRDPDLWERPNSFEPERFLGSEVDVKGHDFELIPFGGGRRVCVGLPLAIRMLHLTLASLIHAFDWKLDSGVSSENMNMEEKFGITLQKAQTLRAIPVRV